MIDIDSVIEHGSIFKTTFPTGQTFGWRMLTQKEYRVFRGLRELNILPEFSLYCKVFEKAYLGNYGLISRKVPLGMIITMGKLCMSMSGDNSSETIRQDIEVARMISGHGSLDDWMRNVIFTAFPNYTIEDLEEWTRVQFIKNFAIAESLLVSRIGHEPIDLDEVFDGKKKKRGRTRKEFDSGPIDFDADHQAMYESMGADYISKASEIAEREWQEDNENLKEYKGKGISRGLAKKLDKIRRTRG